MDFLILLQFITTFQKLVLLKFEKFSYWKSMHMKNMEWILRKKWGNRIHDFSSKKSELNEELIMWSTKVGVVVALDNCGGLIAGQWHDWGGKGRLVVGRGGRRWWNEFFFILFYVLKKGKMKILNNFLTKKSNKITIKKVE